MARRALAATALAALTALGGCSAADDSETQAAAITPAEAVKRGNFGRPKLVVAGHPASLANAKRYGIKEWALYEVRDPKTKSSATVMYATDANGDVKYGVIVGTDGDETKFSLVEFDKKGVDSTPTLTAKTYATLSSDLRADIEAMDRKVQAALDGDRRGILGNVDECALRLVAIGTGAVLVALAAGYVGAAVGMVAGVGVGISVGSAATLTEFIATVAISMGYAGIVARVATPVIAMAAGTLTFVNDAARRIIWTDTLQSCQAAGADVWRDVETIVERTR